MVLDNVLNILATVDDDDHAAADDEDDAHDDDDCEWPASHRGDLT